MPHHSILGPLRDNREKLGLLIPLQCEESKRERSRKSISSVSLSPSAEQRVSCHRGRQGPPCSGIMYLHAVDWLWPMKCGWKRCVSLLGESDKHGLLGLLFLQPQWLSMFQMELTRQTCGVSDNPVLWGCYCCIACLSWLIYAVLLGLWIFFFFPREVINSEFLVKYIFFKFCNEFISHIYNIWRVGQKSCVGQWFPVSGLDTGTLW